MQDKYFQKIYAEVK